jgi:predicted Rossmann-fold nucleotide-binding protein
MKINSISQFNSANLINFASKKTNKQPQTYAILGSSKSTDDILKYMDICSEATKSIILNGDNIITGCGNSGIMGAAFNSGKNYSIRENDIPIQNQAFIMQPLWGDEDLNNCKVRGFSTSEAQRIEQFRNASDKFIIFPGSATTLQEATSLIAKNYYSPQENQKEVILVGKEFFSGLEKQYQQLYKSNLIKTPPEKLFKIVDSLEELEETLKE